MYQVWERGAEGRFSGSALGATSHDHVAVLAVRGRHRRRACGCACRRAGSKWDRCRPPIRPTISTARIWVCSPGRSGTRPTASSTITLHPNASLFSATAIKSAVRIGQAQAGEILISLHDGEDPMFGIDVMPFLATSYEDARKLWAASQPAIEARLAQEGLIVAVRRALAAAGHLRPRRRSIDRRHEGLVVAGLQCRRPSASPRSSGPIPVTIQAADLQQALATGLINAFMTSGATGYDSKAWEHMSYFYDTQAWIPKNVTFVNKAAFEALDSGRRAAPCSRPARTPRRAAGRCRRTRPSGTPTSSPPTACKVLPPSKALKDGLQRIGEQLTDEWLDKAGADGGRWSLPTRAATDVRR